MHSYINNFILLGSNLRSMDEEAAQLVQEAALQTPEGFLGKRQSFPFELRYVPPFDKTFHELKRLQGTAAVNAGYRNTFKGYIVMDLSAYLKHADEAYLDIALKFLHDQQGDWKYIFMIGEHPSKASLDLARKVLSIIPCTMVESKGLSEEEYIQKLCRDHDILLSESALEFLANFISKNGDLREVMPTVICELSMRTSKDQTLSTHSLRSYFLDRTSVVNYLLSREKRAEALERLSGEEVIYDGKI